LKKIIYLLLGIIICNVLKGATFNIINPILCNGDSATVEIIGTTGFPPYTNVGIFTFAAGTHTIIISDSLNNSDTLIFSITQPNSITVNSVEISSPLLCFGDLASVQVEKSGGVGFASIIDTLQIPGGAQIITVSDSNGCIGTDSIYINQPSELFANLFVVSPILCHGDTAEVSVGATGGTPPYTNNSNAFYGAGNYTTYVSDFNACVDSISFQITEPAALNVVVSSTNDNGTNNGSANFTLGGGTGPYLLYLDSVLQFGVSINNLPAGTYNYYILDSNFCLISGVLEIKLQYPANIISHNTSSLTVYPNPIINGQTIVQFPDELNEIQLFEILNLQGELVSGLKINYQILSNNKLLVNCNSLQSGIYFIRLKANTGLYITKFIVL
jgi:hypothetical protein